MTVLRRAVCTQCSSNWNNLNGIFKAFNKLLIKTLKFNYYGLSLRHQQESIKSFRMQKDFQQCAATMLNAFLGQPLHQVWNLVETWIQEPPNVITARFFNLYFLVSWGDHILFLKHPQKGNPCHRQVLPATRSLQVKKRVIALLHIACRTRNSIRILNMVEIQQQTEQTQLVQLANSEWFWPKGSSSDDAIFTRASTRSVGSLLRTTQTKPYASISLSRGLKGYSWKPHK